jgi:hypothetical protein
VNFLSHPVLKGFSVAAAITIGTSQVRAHLCPARRVRACGCVTSGGAQLGSFLGYKTTSATDFPTVIRDVFSKVWAWSFAQCHVPVSDADGVARSRGEQISQTNGPTVALGCANIVLLPLLQVSSRLLRAHLRAVT